MDTEQWKLVKEYSDYAVSTQGRVFSRKTKRILKPSKATGYPCVNLCKDGIRTAYYVHRLVADAFIPNPHDLQYVNHIDGNKLNNNVSNLEWCTAAQNTQHAVSTGIMRPGKRNKVARYTTNGQLLDTFESTMEASHVTGINQSDISQCALGRRYTAGGFFWKYTDGGV